MSLNTKKLSQLEVLESAEGTHVLVEQNGTHKRVPADKIGGGPASIDVTATVGQTIVVTEVDANGKPTKWEAADYQEKICGTAMVEFLPETTIPLDDGLFEMTNSPYNPEEGKHYRVTWNGEVYECVAKRNVDAESGAYAIYVGNGSFWGGEDTGEPFVMGYISDYGASVIMSTDETVTSATIKIEGEVATPIPVQYMTNALPYYIEVTGSGAVDMPYVVHDTVANVRNIYQSGRQLFVRNSISDDGVWAVNYIPLVGLAEQNGQRIYGFYAQGQSTASAFVFRLLEQEDGTFAILE